MSELSEIKVLVIDDEQTYLDLIADTLKGKNYKILQALNGKMGCMVAQKFMPDIIVTDWEMPEMNGIETIYELKSHEETKDIPVIMCTGIMTSSQNLDAALNAGAVDYIRKPIDPLELIARLNSALKLSESIKRIKQQNKSIIQNQEELETQKEEITAQRDLLAKQKSEITDSIVYASLIQQALLPSEEILEDSPLHHFIFYKPRDIVSGDFYWFKQIGKYFYVAAADCTGHGIPGAFMMTLGISMLDEVFNRSEIIPPDIILDELRNKFRNILNKNKTKDGMDIALCLIDIETKKLQFSGANSPIYIIRNNNLTKYKADIMPIGSFHKEDQDFTQYNIQLQSNDLIYLFSDGYLSQFGGEKAFRFTSKRFQETLLSGCHEKMEMQKNLLEKALINWKGNNKQVDDILVIGLKID